ncbi:LamG domain-containing protein, partial [bacterium]|nr:LamG domain-containing protein [bacterium]
LGKPAALSIAGVPFTVAAWVKTSAPNGVVVARGGAFCGYSLYVKDGLPKFGIHRVEDGPTYVAAGKDKLTAEWTHLAGVVRADRIEVYVNGTLAGSTKTKGYIPGNCGQGMEIGFDVSNSPAEITDPFVGIIDEVKVFNAALSADEIAKHCGLGR